MKHLSSNTQIDFRLCSASWGLKELVSPLSSGSLLFRMNGSQMTCAALKMTMYSASCRATGSSKWQKSSLLSMPRSSKKSNPSSADKKDTYKVPYELHPVDRPRQCVFIGTSNSMSFLSLQLSDHAYTIVSTGTGNVVMTKEQRIKFEKRRFIMFVHIRNDDTLIVINPPDETKQGALRFWNTLTPDKKRLSTQTEDQLIDKLYDYYGGGYKKRCNL